MPSMTSGITKKNGGTPEGARQGNQHMLNVAEKPARAKLLRLENNQFVTQSPEKRAADWLESVIAESQDNITTRIIDLTPALATALLNRNPENRRISKANVDAFARDMRNGRWELNGESVIVARTGELNDGQNRCTAVVEADVTIKTVLVVGAERDSRTTLDQGKNRTVGDYLAMDGVTDSNVVGAVGGYVIQYLNSGNLSYGRLERPTKGEIRDFIKKNPSILYSASFAGRREAAAVGGKSIIAFCHWVFSRAASSREAGEFISGIMFGEGMSLGNPALYARNRLIMERGNLRPNAKCELIFKAWNAYRRNETVRRLNIMSTSDGSKLPKVEA